MKKIFLVSFVSILISACSSQEHPEEFGSDVKHLEDNFQISNISNILMEKSSSCSLNRLQGDLTFSDGSRGVLNVYYEDIGNDDFVHIDLSIMPECEQGKRGNTFKIFKDGRNLIVRDGFIDLSLSLDESMSDSYLYDIKIEGYVYERYEDGFPYTKNGLMVSQDISEKIYQVEYFVCQNKDYVMKPYKINDNQWGCN